MKHQDTFNDPLHTLKIPELDAGEVVTLRLILDFGIYEMRRFLGEGRIAQCVYDEARALMKKVHPESRV